MREFTFTPGYYEWHLRDKHTKELLHVMEDPIDSMYFIDFDTNEETPVSPEELMCFCLSELETADVCYEENEEYNGLFLNDLQRLDEQEMSEAAQIMFEVLKEHYID